MIQFLYGDDTVSLSDTRADTTVLEWLRLHAKQTGTKEGCASGDCGACTVVVAQLNNESNGLTYQPVNSCIAFVGSLHGKQLITVEQLASNTALHPVQQAMVNEHGSQCGFCTPGFVMSMFAHYHANEVVRNDPHQVEHALAGNLCRCTGYKPIKQAMAAALQHSGDKFSDQQVKTIDALRAIEHSQADGCRYFIPDSLTALFELQQQHPKARIVAGATDLALEVTQRQAQLDALIDVKSIKGLNNIEQLDNTITLGAAVSVQQCMQVLAPLLPSAEQLILRFGSSQVRNQATIGGNIGNASPIGDLPPLLLALDATLQLHGPQGERSVPIDEFYLGYKQTALQAQEIITAVSFTLPPNDHRFAIYKISKRMDDDISAVCLAICLQVKDEKVASLRLAFGGMAAIPLRVKAAEQAALGRSWSEATVEHLQQVLAGELTPLSDARASAEYRAAIAANLVSRFFHEGSTPIQQTQVVEHVGG